MITKVEPFEVSFTSVDDREMFERDFVAILQRRCLNCTSQLCKNDFGRFTWLSSGELIWWHLHGMCKA